MGTHARFFIRVFYVGWDCSVEFCVVALRGNRGPDCATCSPSKIDVVLYPGSHKVGVCLYCTCVILVEACGHSFPPPPFPCTVQMLFPSRSAGISPPPPHPFFVGGPGFDWGCVLFLHVAGHPEKSITLLRLMVVASSRLFLIPVGVGLMSVLSMLSPLSAKRLK